MKANAYFIAAALMCSGLHAQAIMDHAAAIAGAGIGTAGGKALSNTIEKTLGKAADLAGKEASGPKNNTKAATTTNLPVTVTTVPGAPTAPDPIPVAKSTHKATRPQHPVSDAEPMVAGAER